MTLKKKKEPRCLLLFFVTQMPCDYFYYFFVKGVKYVKGGENWHTYFFSPWTGLHWLGLRVGSHVKKDVRVDKQEAQLVKRVHTSLRTMSVLRWEGVMAARRRDLAATWNGQPARTGHREGKKMSPISFNNKLHTDQQLMPWTSSSKPSEFLRTMRKYFLERPPQAQLKVKTKRAKPPMRMQQVHVELFGSLPLSPVVSGRASRAKPHPFCILQARLSLGSRWPLLFIDCQQSSL